MTADELSGGLLAGWTVLIVEDQYLIAEELGAIVGRLGGRVLGPVSGVGAAMAALQPDMPELALLDVSLDGERVYPLAAVLREAGVPFAFTTGHDAEEIDLRFRDTPYLVKPVSEARLTQALRDMLARR